MNIVKSPTQAILSGPISPPSSSESPTYALPPNTAISISEEALPSYMTVYRGTVASTKHDVQVLEGTMPLWLLEYLLLNKIPTIPPHQKISFVLLPCPMPDGEEQLPEFLNTYGNCSLRRVLNADCVSLVLNQNSPPVGIYEFASSPPM